MKYGYACKCGWRLKRLVRTRRQYAEEKIVHSLNCEALHKELKRTERKVK